MRRKSVPLPRAAAPTRPTVAARGARAVAYATWTIAELRSLGLAAALLAPLGALAGSVAACGGAAPVQRPMVEPHVGAYAPPAPSAAVPDATPAVPSAPAASSSADRPAAPVAPVPPQGPVPVAM